MILSDVHRRVLQSKHPVQEICLRPPVSQMPQQALPGICVKKQIDSKLPPGAICEVGRECASGNCMVHPTINRSVCIRNCDASSVTSCENGQICFDGTCLNKNNEQGIPCVIWKTNQDVNVV